MKQKLKGQKLPGNGDVNTTIEIKNPSIENECKNIIKKWMKNCPNCKRDMHYSYQTGLINSLRLNTVCRWCIRTDKFKFKFTRLCDCGNLMGYSTKYSMEKSKIEKQKCRKCISKNFPSPMSRIGYVFTKSHRNKIGIKSTERQLGTKHTGDRVQNMISGLVNMPYEEWIKICPEIKRYRRKVHHLSRKNCKLNKIERFGDSGYDMDHIFPVSECFKLGVPVEIASDITNIRIIPSLDNKIKSSKISEIPLIIRPYYEKNIKNRKS